MRFYHRFVNETLDSNGTLKTFEPKLPDNYNFGYDVVDAIASETPDKLAMVWCNAFGDDKQFTFSDISRLSTKTANVFSKYGIKKGDKVLLLLKRHYEYWYAVVALPTRTRHKTWPQYGMNVLLLKHFLSFEKISMDS